MNDGKRRGRPLYVMVKIGRLRPEDVSEAIRIWRNTKGVGVGTSDTPERVRAFLRRNPGLSSVAKDGGMIVGVVMCGHDGRRGYLHHLAVINSHRRKGIGAKLVRRCLDRLAREGILKCNGFLLPSNIQGRKFWKAIGWRTSPGPYLIQCPTSPAKGPRRAKR